MDANQAMRNFRGFLCAGHDWWLQSARDIPEQMSRSLDEAFHDWAQANWELLVERPLCGVGEFLEVYGPGSDYEEQPHSRVFFHEARPTHKISCIAAGGETVVDSLSGGSVAPEEWEFEALVSRSAAWYVNGPPFDHVLLERGRGEVAIVPFAAVGFERVPVG